MRLSRSGLGSDSEDFVLSGTTDDDDSVPEIESSDSVTPDDYQFSNVEKGKKCCSKFVLRKVSMSDPKCFQSPQGTRCECQHLSDVNLLDPKFWREHDGLNVILPNYDIEDTDKWKYFGITNTCSEFSIEQLMTLSIDELNSMKDDIKRDLEMMSMVSTANTDPVPIICPFAGVDSRAIAIHADVRTYDFKPLMEHVGQFNVILMDPPWMIQPTDAARGVSIRYKQMRTEAIADLALEELQQDGFLFMWVVARKFHEGIGMMMNWGYEIIGHVNWEKVSSNGNAAPSHGYYLQHQKETCLVGRKGKPFEAFNMERFRDLIVTSRTHNQSEKPHELYEMIEEMFPEGMYLEIFARDNNIRNNWVSIGLDITQ